VPEACAMLDRQASTKQRLIWIALANALVVGATVGISIALPDADRLPLNTPTIEQTRTVTTAPITVASAPEVQASATQVQASTSIAPASAPSSAPASGSSAPAFATTPTPQPALIAKEPVAVTPPAAAISTPPAPSIVEKPIAPEKPADKAASKAANNVASKTTEKTKTNEATDGKKIYINVGLFAKESNARNAHDKLTKAGLPAKEQQVTGSKGTFTRVRVGPYKTLAQAEKAAEKIKSQGLEAVVVRQ
jgi:cell division septation protein DedD